MSKWRSCRRLKKSCGEADRILKFLIFSIRHSAERRLKQLSSGPKPECPTTRRCIQSVGRICLAYASGPAVYVGDVVLVVHDARFRILRIRLSIKGASSNGAARPMSGVVRQGHFSTHYAGPESQAPLRRLNGFPGPSIAPAKSTAAGNACIVRFRRNEIVCKALKKGRPVSLLGRIARSFHSMSTERNSTLAKISGILA